MGVSNTTGHKCNYLLQQFCSLPRLGHPKFETAHPIELVYKPSWTASNWLFNMPQLLFLILQIWYWHDIRYDNTLGDFAILWLMSWLLCFVPSNRRVPTLPQVVYCSSWWHMTTAYIPFSRNRVSYALEGCTWNVNVSIEHEKIKGHLICLFCSTTLNQLGL